MNYSIAIFLISDDVRAVACQYEAKETAPKTLFKTLDKNIKPEDFVVVPTNTRHGMTVVRVTDVDVEIDYDTSEKIDWIIGTVSTEDYDGLKDQEAAAIEKIRSAEKRKRREELRDALLADTGDELKAIPIFRPESAEEASE